MIVTEIQCAVYSKITTSNRFVNLGREQNEACLSPTVCTWLLGHLTVIQRADATIEYNPDIAVLSTLASQDGTQHCP